MAKVVFWMVRNDKRLDFLKGNCKFAWDMLAQMYAQQTASSLFKLKSKFHISKLGLAEMDPNEWILNLEGL